MAARAEQALEEAKRATATARSANARGYPQQATAALQIAEKASDEAARLHQAATATIPGLNWAEEVDNEKGEKSKTCVVNLAKDGDRLAKEALEKDKAKRTSGTNSRYRTISSSSSTVRTEDDDDFVKVQRRRRGHRPNPVRDRLEKERREAAAERRNARDPRNPRITVLLTEQQRKWYLSNKCLNCGAGHRVYNCQDKRLSMEKSSALLRAARKEFPDGAGSTAAPSGGSSTSRSTKRSAAWAAGQKRTREEKTGVTPDAKRATWARISAPLPNTKPWFKPVQQTEFTLFFRGKDGTPMTEEQFNDVKSAYDKIRIRIGRHNIQAKTAEERQFTPRCSGWNWGQEVARITLKDEQSFRWARQTFRGQYQVMDLNEWQASKGKIFCAYPTDKFDPSITGGWKDEELSIANWQAGVDLGLDAGDLFQFVRAPKVARRRLIFISVGEKAEEAMKQANFKLEIGSAGDVQFTDHELYKSYKREKREQELAIARQQQEQQQDEEEADKTLTQDARVVVIEEEKTEAENLGGQGEATGDNAEEDTMDKLEGVRDFIQMTQGEPEEEMEGDSGPPVVLTVRKRYGMSTSYAIFTFGTI